MPCRLNRFACYAVAMLCLGSAGGSFGQAMKSASDYPDSKVDIYAGYAYWHPIDSGINGYQYQDISNPNLTASVSFFFNHYIGVQMEGAYFSGNNQHLDIPGACVSNASCDQLVYTAEAGPIVRFPMGKFVPFIHALGGGERMNGPAAQPLKWGWGVTGGGGVDYILPF